MQKQENISKRNKNEISKKYNKQSKGITLIALVITIIVLLILAGVTINTLFGNESVLEKASEAKEEDAHGKVKDQIQLELVNYELEKGTGETNKTAIQYLSDKGYFNEAYSEETESYTIKAEKISNVSTGKGASKEAGDVYVVEKESEENNNWVLRYYKTSSDVKDLLTITSTGKIDEEVEDEIMPEATIEQLQERGYSVGMTNEGNILAADTKDTKVILYKYDSEGKFINKEYLEYTDPTIFEFDKGTGAITSIKLSEEPEHLGYYEDGVGINMEDLTELVIPKKIDGEEVKSVKLCTGTNYSDLIGIKRVIVPNTVTDIGTCAFENCDDVEVITLPANLRKIENVAFHECRFNHIILPNKLEYLSGFSGCENLSEIEIPNSVTSIGNSAFASCHNLSSIKIPNGVTSIGNSAFWCSRNLSEIIIPNSVTSIGDSAFDSCHNLSSIEIPNSVTSIGPEAFISCTSLNNIEIPNGVESIEWSTFEGCSSLTSIKIPNSVTSIENCAFDGCTSLSKVWIPSSVKSIEKNAFRNIASDAIIYVENDQVKQLLIANGYNESQIKVEPYPSED